MLDDNYIVGVCARLNKQKTFHHPESVDGCEIFMRGDKERLTVARRSGRELK